MRSRLLRYAVMAIRWYRGNKRELYNWYKWYLGKLWQWGNIVSEQRQHNHPIISHYGIAQSNCILLVNCPTRWSLHCQLDFQIQVWNIVQRCASSYPLIGRFKIRFSKMGIHEWGGICWFGSHCIISNPSFPLSGKTPFKIFHFHNFSTINILEALHNFLYLWNEKRLKKKQLKPIVTDDSDNLVSNSHQH